MKMRKLLAFAAAMCMAGQIIPAGSLYADAEPENAEFTYGDVNGDGKVDITDLSTLSLYLIKDINLEGNLLKAADTDGDSQVNLGDLAHFRRYLSKYSVTLGPNVTSSLMIKQASDYSDLSSIIEKAESSGYDMWEDGEMAETTSPATNNGTSTAPTASPTMAPNEADSSSEKKNYSETYNQEENVIEADIVKTDGNAIYSFTSASYSYYGYGGQISVVYPDNGKFKKAQTIKIDLSGCAAGEVRNISAENMYIYNDMIIVLGTVSVNDSEAPESGEHSGIYLHYNSYKEYTFVSAYRKGTEEKEPELIDTYYQEGYFNDVRITPDGYMYLISSDSFYRWNYYTDYYVNEAADSTTENTEESSKAISEEEIKAMIPETGTNSGMEAVAPENIYVPCCIDDTFESSYTVIGSINLNSSESFDKTDAKIITGYTGDIYCSENNLYLTHRKYSYHYLSDTANNNETSWDETEITRLSLSEGKITPEASGEVPGYVLNQFSMSEYDGYFRIVTTANYNTYKEDDNGTLIHSSERSNNVYVLDMNLRKTGEITHFAKNESVKSVSFAGKLGYVVTYVQTDPLFAIDFTDPEKPVILDEYKIDGYSTYMQKWDDEHLLGFGVSTYVTESNRTVTDGYKLVMFNNSDPENLSEEGIYKLIRNNIDTLKSLSGISEDDIYSSNNVTDGFSIYLYSGATYERKELLIAPEKNLIGFPVTYEANWNSTDFDYSKSAGSGYCFFSYENGEFTMKNYLSDSNDSAYYNRYYRAVYIGDYVYIVSSDKMMAADIDTCTMTDEISLNADKN